jgi:hypothetical protein
LWQTLLMLIMTRWNRSKYLFWKMFRLRELKLIPLFQSFCRNFWFLLELNRSTHWLCWMCKQTLCADVFNSGRPRNMNLTHLGRNASEETSHGNERKWSKVQNRDRIDPPGVNSLKGVDWVGRVVRCGCWVVMRYMLLIISEIQLLLRRMGWKMLMG